jgi:hypothetical protein
MNSYKHTQRGTLIITAMLVMSVTFIIIGATVSRPVLVAVPVLFLCGWLFHSLTIEIVDGELRWHFGPGLIHKHVRLDEISGVQRARTNVLEGWGIHLSRFGWLYNVSGFDAVAITLKTGKRFALGTDDVDGLLTAIDSALGVPRFAT